MVDAGRGSASPMSPGSVAGQRDQDVMPAASRPVVHLELHTGDLSHAQILYAELCGWQAKRIHAGRGSYLALDLNRRLGGGIVECETGHPIWLPYVEVPDIAAVTESARALGATVLLEPREGPAGWRSVIATPSGGEIAFWQPKR
jgi:predicted enzyme related to lactoylglutathione lyase